MIKPFYSASRLKRTAIRMTSDGLAGTAISYNHLDLGTGYCFIECASHWMYNDLPL